MSIEIPEYVNALGTWNAWLIPAAADLDSITLAELAAGVDITCYLPETAWDGITGEQNKGEQTRACRKDSFEVLGRVKRGVSAITYTVLPQEELSAPGNEVAEACADEGADKVLVVRRGLDADVAPAAGQKYSAIRLKVGMTKENVGASDEFAPTTDMTEFSTQGGVVPGSLAAA